MNNLDPQYINLLEDILTNGVKKQTRNGGTVSVFGRQIRHKMSDGYPLLTTKKMAFKTMVTELLWFLRGDTNIKYLVDNGCNIWNGDAYKNYCKKWGGQNRYSIKTPILEDGVVVGSSNRKFTKEEFINEIKTNPMVAKELGELGPIYGKQWRRWSVTPNQYGEYETNPIDQIANLIKELKSNPDSRRLMVNAWNVGELDKMTLPPCHYGFQCYVREGKYLSLMWNQRSVDTFLGLPFNIASYGLLLEIIAKEVNMIPDELIGNLGDVHLYSNHIEQAKEQLTREPMKLPKLNELPNYLCMKDDWECYKPSDFTLENYQSHPAIKAPLSN